MNEGFQGLSSLERAVAAIARATTPAEMFRELLDGTASGSPRAVVFLLRDQRWKGWKAIGYGPLVAQAAQSVSLSDQDGWLARAAASEDGWIEAAGEPDLPDFGQAPPETAIALPVRVGGKAVATVLAERGSGEQPWHPAALAVLVQAVRLRLEFDLACRRLRAAGVSPADDAPAVAAEPPPAVEAPAIAAGPPPAVEAPGIAAEPPPAMEAPAVVVEPPPAVDAPAIAAEPLSAMEAPMESASIALDPWHDPTPAPSPNPEHDEARRFARLVATDIRLYNEEAVAYGRVQGDLAARLGEQMQKGRESFERRFPSLGRDGMSILRESFVQVLAGGDASLIPPD